MSLYIYIYNEKLNEIILLLFFNEADRRLFFSSILSLVAFFLYGASFLPSSFPSPFLPLGVMLNDQTYIETRASACSP